MPAVVFLTAYDQFALRAFDIDAYDYLVKPVSDERFATTIARLRKRLGAKGPRTDGRKDAVVVATARGELVLPFHEIDWIEATNNYARVWAAGRSYLLRESLGELERRFAQHGFLRVHRGAIVRIDAVRSIENVADGVTVAVLHSGTSVPVSRRRRSELSAAVREVVR
jgi:two-component system LytT family response regulator